MSKKTTTCLLVASGLVVFGGLTFVATMTACDWDFTKLNGKKYQTNTYEVNEVFDDISIQTDSTDIIFAPSEDGKCKVVCFERENATTSVAVQNGKLTIDTIGERKWYEYIMNFDEPKTTVYLPEDDYASLYIQGDTSDIEIAKEFSFQSVEISVDTGDVKNCASVKEYVKIRTSTGDIQMENASAGALDFSVTTGDVTLSNVNCEGDLKIGVSTGKSLLDGVVCKNLTSSGDTGDIQLKNVIAKETFCIERSTGDVKFEKCDAAEIFVETDTGDVKGTLCSEKVFLPKTDTGKINVPKSVTGGKCEIITDTGDIILALA